ncbi:recombination mediator RecR [Patescibacteria group bacterium]|nr:recombination mediator RecR [Patescibacteria group bacterium]MBU4274463.1 recombination mediator RecR [Patescibacteria group bacterium]MBU4367938.1 recombination mediator RecR [Patescibacteria group bacterium]MBU4462276.1 recombination mediator RecR [Patescibacteria group bacterium]MCG2699548.1 recombination mediator RecR [Candidatus Parcubacteria bacterium]
MFSKTIQNLIDLFSKFPTVGPRTAGRFVFYLIQSPKEKIEELIAAIQDLKTKIKYCSFCFNPFDTSIRSSTEAHSKSSDQAEETLCEICKNTIRDRGTLCIVEKETDLITIEKTKKYKGLYFVLGGTVATLKKSDVEKLRIKELEEHLRNPQSFGIITIFKEIIVATNPTPEGRATAILIERTIKGTLKNNLPKISHLGLGLPVGGELEYADEETLESAFEGRK